jgi:hypothetical protein
MKNEKKTKEKAVEKPEKEEVDVELDDKALDAVSGGTLFPSYSQIKETLDYLRNPPRSGEDGNIN